MTEFTFITEALAHWVLFAVCGIAIFLVSLMGTWDKFKARIPLMALFFAAFLGVSYFSLGELLGRPKPVQILTWDRPDVEEARVMAQFHRKDEGIWLLLMYEGLTVPRYFQFPWDEEMSKKLKRGEAAQRMKEIQGVKLKLPFQRSWEDRKFPEVHEIPWPKPPGKDAPTVEQFNLDEIDA